MMMVQRDVHAESNDLRDYVPRRHPLQHATAWLLATSPILGNNSRGRSKAIISRSSFTSLFLLRSQDSPSCGPYGSFSQKSLAKPGLHPKLQPENFDDLCSSALGQQRSNLVNQCVARFYLLVSDGVFNTVSCPSLELSPCLCQDSLLALF